MFSIAPEYVEPFKIWLESLEYIKKDLPDGGSTYKNRKLKPNYVLVTSGRTGNSACRQLYKEFIRHINS